MSQPFDNRDWDLRQLAEKDAEIARLKTQHEEILLKHAKEQSIALSTLLTALKEIERLRALVGRAADALEEEFGSPSDPAYGIKGPVHELIAELRKAAE
jgi:hypothetical protein